jgi:hypothetical protein
MNTEQKISDTFEFAKQFYSDQPSIYRRTLMQHATAVAKMAEKISMQVYQDVREDFMSEDTRESVAAIVHAAILHDIINVSRCAFEQIAERTTVQIAALVADLSRDFRLVETKRDMEFRGRLSQSPVGAQIIAVSDIICTAKEVVDMLTDRGLEAIPRARKILMQLDGDLLVISAASRFYTLRLYTHAARNLLQDASKLIKECRAKAKMARIVDNATAGFRSKVAAKISQANEETNNKETSGGKKRTRRRNS